MSYKDKEKNRLYCANYYKEHREAILTWNREWRKNRPFSETEKAARIKRAKKHSMKFYGLTPEEFKKQRELQKDLCKLCNRPERRINANGTLHVLQVDHDHVTKKFRGLLCGPCNRALGLLQDSPDLLRLAADYIESNKIA